MDDKEFTFESEQILKKKNRKKIILIAAISAAVIAAAVVTIILVVSARRKKIHRSEEGLPFSYTWQENSEGGIDLSLDRSEAPDYDWVLVSTSEGMTVSAPASQPDKTSNFSLISSETGNPSAVFGLQKGDDPYTRTYEMEFSLYTALDEEGNFVREFVFKGVKQVQTAVEGGADSEHPYIIQRDEADGTILVFIEDNWLRTESTANLQQEEAMLEENLQELLEWIENDSVPEDSHTNSYSGEPAAAEDSYKNPFTGEPCSAEELRKVLLEHKDELEQMLKDDLQPETYLTMHQDWTAASSDEAVVFVRELDLSWGEGEIPNQVVLLLSYGGTSGTADVTVRSDTAGAQLVMTIRSDDEGSFIVEDHRLESFEPIEQEGEYEPEAGSVEETAGETVEETVE